MTHIINLLQRSSFHWTHHSFKSLEFFGTPFLCEAFLLQTSSSQPWWKGSRSRREIRENNGRKFQKRWLLVKMWSTSSMFLSLRSAVVVQELKTICQSERHTLFGCLIWFVVTIDCLQELDWVTPRRRHFKMFLQILIVFIILFLRGEWFNQKPY